MGIQFEDPSLEPYQNGRFDVVHSTVTHSEGSVGVIYGIDVTHYNTSAGSGGTEVKTTFTYTTGANDTATTVVNNLVNQINNFYEDFPQGVYKVSASGNGSILKTEQTSETPNPYGFIVTTTKDFSSLTMFTETDFVTCLANDAGKIHFHSETNQLWSDTVMDLTSDQEVGTYFPTFFSADGELRVSDATLSTNTKPKGLYYMDYIAAGELEHSTPDGTSTAGWGVDPAYCPNEGGLSEGVYHSGGNPSSTGNRDNIAAEPGNTQINWWEETDGNSTWGTEAWPIYYTLVYDGRQISIPKLVYKDSATIKIEMTADDDCPAFEIAWKAGTTGSSRRVTGFQWYLRYKGQLYYFLEADRKKGIRLANKTDYTAWSDVTGYNYAETGAVPNPILVETFDTMNGYSWRLPANGFDADGTGFRTACVANRRTWVGNVKVKDRDGIIQTLPDAVIKSPVNQFDVLPYDNIIEPVVNDGSEVSALFEFADRLLMFKTVDLYIINIGGALEYLEQKIAFGGIDRPQQASNTPYGIAWINQRGLYLFNGKETIKLNEKQGRSVLSESQLQLYSGTYSAMGYDFKLNKLFLRPDYSGSTSTLIYDFNTESFLREEGAYAGTVLTNFAQNREGRIIWGRHMGSIATTGIQTIEDNPSTRWGNLETGYLDFGDPAQFKQFQSLYITYTTGDIDEPASDPYTENLTSSGGQGLQIRVYVVNETGQKLELKARNSKEPLVDNITDDGVGRAVLKYTNIMQTAGLKLKQSGKKNFRAVKIVLTGYFPSAFELEDMTITFKPKKPR